jgi:hypothetical protein
MNDNSHNRLFASQSSSFRLYAENYDEVKKICEDTGRKPAEVLRDAVDEWLLARRAGAPGGSITQGLKNDLAAEVEELRQAVERLAGQYESLARSVDYVQRRDHGYLLQIFLAAYGARDLIWRDVSNRMRQGKQTPESIQKQYEALEREWNVQCNAMADNIKGAILTRTKQEDPKQADSGVDSETRPSNANGTPNEAQRLTSSKTSS